MGFSYSVGIIITQLVSLNCVRCHSSLDEGPHYIETSSLICIANQSTGLYMVGTSVMKELINCFSLFPVYLERTKSSLKQL